MILYSIRRKRDKKFFAGFRWYDGKASFCVSPVMYKQIDTIIRHLKWLCSDEIYLGFDRRGKDFQNMEPAGMIYQRLRSYEVMVYDFRLHKPRKKISAAKFYKDIKA